MDDHAAGARVTPQQITIWGDPEPHHTGRDELDRYYTPHRLARVLVQRLAADEWSRQGCLGPPLVLEPHAGGCAFVDAIAAEGCPLYAHDLDPTSRAVTERGALVRSFLDPWPADLPRPEWIVGNPPYDAAGEHTAHALGLARVGVAFLLRLAFLETKRRIPFWQGPGACLHTVYVLAERPSFVSTVTAAGATDSAAYGWFVWRHDHEGPARVVPCLSWR